MRIEEPAKDLFGNQTCPFAGIGRYWVDSSTRFGDFCSDNASKIQARIKKARDDDGNLAGVQAELEMAYLLLQNECFSVEYEHRYEQPRGPDLTVTDHNTKTDGDNSIFNVEVKRIRKRDPEKRLESWKVHTRDQIERQISSVLSTLSVSIDINDFSVP